MKKTIALLASIIIIFISNSTTDAAILRVNNSPGMAAPYTNLPAAVTAASTGDTIYIEGSSTSYTGITISKKLRIIGAGYFLNESNPHTQADKLEALIPNITFNPGSKGSVIQGVKVNSINLRDSLITVERCHVNTMYLAGEGASIYGDTIRNNYITNSVNSYSGSGSGASILLYNNIFTGSIPLNMNASANGYVVNNTFAPLASSTFICSSFLFQNNIIKNPNFGVYISSNVFYNNISTNASGIPGGNGNISNADWNFLFTGDPAASTDGRFTLSASSEAKNAGIINTTVVDCGAFGGAAPYILSGMPNIPSIYELIVPDAVPSGTPTMLINLSAASH